MSETELLVTQYFAQSVHRGPSLGDPVLDLNIMRMNQVEQTS